MWHTDSIRLRYLLPVLAGVALLCPGRIEAQDLVRFEGLQSVSTEQARTWLKPQITFINSTGVSMARADDVAYFLENAMRERGYKKASVDWKLIGEGDGRHILLQVSEGSSSTISGFRVSGNEALEDDAVVELMTATTRKRLELKPDATLPYVKSDLASGRKKILQFYALLGYNNVEIDVDSETSASGIQVIVQIDEGIQKSVGEIVLPTATSLAMEEKFEKVREDFVGRKFNGGLVANLKTRLRSIAVNSGYYEADVEITEEEIAGSENSEAQMRLIAAIEWGAPVSVSGISVTGNERVKNHFFERHFGDLVGQPYSPGETTAAVDELLQTGAFETIRTDPVQQEDGSLHLNVEVEESYTRTLGVFGGFTNYEGPIGGFEFRNLNLLGSVRTLDSAIEFSRRGARGELNFSDPWFLDTDLEFGAGLFGQNRQEEGYEKWEVGGNYKFSKSFGEEDRSTVALFGRASYTEVQDADISAPFLGDTEYFVHFLGLSLSHDARDDPASPREGFIAQTSAGVSTSGLGSEVDYFKATGRLGYYHPVGNHNFRMAARAGMINPIGDTNEIPIDLRLYNGGPQTVRSFQERSLGPRDPISGYHIGGEFYTIFNVEYEIPVKQVDGLSFVAFGDAGNLLLDANDASLDQLRYAIGVGLRYRTPIGPLRFEYGYNPDQQPGEPQGTFHVGFGFAY